MSQSAGQPHTPDALAVPRPRATATPGRSNGAPAIAVLLAGSIVTAALAASAMVGGKPPIGLGQVSLTDLEPAIASLEPATGHQAAADALACRIPLAVISLSTVGPPGDLVRVRSGAYLSPPIRLGGIPQRIAIPFPAPYASGHGVLYVEGTTHAMNVALQPPWSVAILNGSVTHAVTWVPGQPC